MLIALIFRLLTLGGAAIGATGSIGPAPRVDVQDDEIVDSPRSAQVRLAETLAGADAIHSVHAKANTVTFTITRGDHTFDVTVLTARKRTPLPTGQVMNLSITETTPSANAIELGGLTWLAEEMASVTAITRLVVDEDGAVTLTTNDGRRYMAIPGRGSGGNAAVEARWAAEWNR